MLMTFSILGLIGGIFCAIGDILFDLKGKGNQKTGPGGLVDSILKTFYKAIAFPFFFGYLLLMTPCVTSVIAILTGCLAVPKWFVLLNSIVFLVIGLTFRKINPKVFQDLPGIIMPSMGLAMLGLIGIVNLM